METNLAQDAITAALNGDWKKALQINELLLKDNPEDTEALNRTARAYAELGKIQKAREIVQKVLKLDPFNSIAQKAFDRWKGLKNGEASSSGPITSTAFLEEPGKTRIASLMHMGKKDTIAELDTGDEVHLNCHSHRVSCLSLSGKYIGRLPDDLSSRIRKLTNLGYEYKVFVKSVDMHEVKILVREVTRPSKLSNIPSFPPERIQYISFTPPELVQEEETFQVDDADDNVTEE